MGNINARHINVLGNIAELPFEAAGKAEPASQKVRPDSAKTRLLRLHVREFDNRAPLHVFLLAEIHQLLAANADPRLEAAAIEEGLGFFGLQPGLDPGGDLAYGIRGRAG